MDKFYIIGVCVLAIGSVCIQLSNGATTWSPPVTSPAVTTGSQTEVTDGGTTSSPPVTSFPVTNGSQTQATDGATTSSPPATTGSQKKANQDITTTTGVTVSTPPSVTDLITDVLNNATTCPRFTSRLENDTLYVSYVEGRCDMVVTIDKISLPPVKLVSLVKRRNRVIRRPAVSFRPIVMEENGEPVTCESLPTRSLGPFVFVDTLTDECQLLLKIQKQKNEAFTLRVPGQKRPGKQEGGRLREPRFTFLPALEYLDEVIY